MPANKQISFESASLAVALIGQGLALARGLVTKHAIKQVDRMLADQGIDVDALLHHWVPFVGKRPSALRWRLTALLEFRQASTHLDTPHLSHRRHPVSRITRQTP